MSAVDRISWLDVFKTQIKLKSYGSAQEIDLRHWLRCFLFFTITPTDNARLLGVSVSADLSLQKRVSTVSARCFYQLRQIRCTRQFLDKDSLAALIHAVVFSRIDYSCSLLTGSPKVVTDKLQRVLNAAARVSRKYDRGLTYARRHD